jgi:hypothetical protein
MQPKPGKKNDAGQFLYDAELIRLMEKAVIAHFHIRKPYYS